MPGKTDIRGLDDIKILVNEFYGKVREDNLLSPIFYERIRDDWQPHLEKMYLFWNAALFGKQGYIGNPFAKHATLPVSDIHFQQWLSLFTGTIDLHFEGPVAELAKSRAGMMAANFIRRLNDMGDNRSNVLV